MFRSALLVLLVSLLLPGVGRAEPVALTFDDVPGLSLSNSIGYAQRTNRRLTAGLVRHALPATGFVVGDKFAGQPRARRRLLGFWAQPGLELANHTWSHLSLNTTPADAYLRDVARDDALLRGLSQSHAGRVWFRYPYLETGATEQVRDDVVRGLHMQGLRVAPVTLENDDDLFAPPYDEAVLHHDRRRIAAIRAAYLAFTDRRIAWYRRAALQLLGRRPALVFLLHDTRLNADTIGELAARLRRQGLQPAGLETVMQDPAYALPDGPATPDGDDWLNRWAAALHRDLPWDDFPDPPAVIAQAAARLDPDR